SRGVAGLWGPREAGAARGVDAVRADQQVALLGSAVLEGGGNPSRLLFAGGASPVRVEDCRVEGVRQHPLQASAMDAAGGRAGLPGDGVEVRLVDEATGAGQRADEPNRAPQRLDGLIQAEAPQGDHGVGPEGEASADLADLGGALKDLGSYSDPPERASGGKPPDAAAHNPRP